MLVYGCQSENDLNEIVNEQLAKSQIDFSVSQELAMKAAIGFFSIDSSVLSARISPSMVNNLRIITGIR